MKSRSYTYRIYPNQDQRKYFSKAFGCVRFIYNQMLANRIDLYKNYGTDKELMKTHKPKTYTEFKREYDWLYEIENGALAYAQMQLKIAFGNFYRNPKKFGFPKFRSKHKHLDSFTTSNQYNRIRFDDSGSSIRIPKIGFVKIVKHRDMPDGHTIKSCTVYRTPSEKYFINIIFEYNIEIPDKTLDANKALGLDYSSPHFYVDSQGAEANMPHFFRETELKLSKERRKLDKMVNGSNNYKKQKLKVAKVHERIANQRKDWLHKKSTELANEWDYICVEDINLRGLSGTLKLGKSTNDNGFGMFREMIKYKLEDRGKVFIKIDKWFPSSKMCSGCGAINKELTLKDREWTCECGAHHDRDINAAINIKRKGMNYVK